MRLRLEHFIKAKQRNHLANVITKLQEFIFVLFKEKISKLICNEI